MKKLGIAVLSAASLVAAGTAMAAEPQWTYAQLGWIQGDGEDDAGKAEGYQLKGSLGIDQFHVALEYVDGDFDYFNDVDFDGYTFTVGFHQPITSSGNTHFVADLSYQDYDLDGGEGWADETTGIGVGFGVRSVLADRVELEGMITYVRGEVEWSGGDQDFTDTGLRVGARYLWTPNFSTGLTLNVNDPRIQFNEVGSDSATFDIRWSFGDLMK